MVENKPEWPIQIDGIEVTKVCIVIRFSIYNIYFGRPTRRHRRRTILAESM